MCVCFFLKFYVRETKPEDGQEANGLDGSGLMDERQSLRMDRRPTAWKWKRSHLNTRDG